MFLKPKLIFETVYLLQCFKSLFIYSKVACCLVYIENQSTMGQATIGEKINLFLKQCTYLSMIIFIFSFNPINQKAAL